MPQTSEITEANLANFYGTSQWYRHWSRQLLMTDGTHFLCENGAAWLIDAIASHQGPRLARACGYFQFWTLKVDLEKHEAVLICQRDSGEPRLVEQKIPYTDFPLAEIKIWVEGEGENKVCLLPSEH